MTGPFATKYKSSGPTHCNFCSGAVFFRTAIFELRSHADNDRHRAQYHSCRTIAVLTTGKSLHYTVIRSSSRRATGINTAMVALQRHVRRPSRSSVPYSVHRPAGWALMTLLEGTATPGGTSAGSSRTRETCRSRPAHPAPPAGGSVPQTRRAGLGRSHPRKGDITAGPRCHARTGSTHRPCRRPVSTKSQGAVAARERAVHCYLGRLLCQGGLPLMSASTNVS